MARTYGHFKPSGRGAAIVPGRTFFVRGLSSKRSTGLVGCGQSRWPCALGRAGRVARKREGDGGTPRGRWRVLAVLYRPDRIRRPRTALPCRPIAGNDGWCDAPHDRNYNRAVGLPYPASAERMWRDDPLYDLVVVLGYNLWPRRRGLGSAIFMHVAREGFKATEGCVALRRRDLLRLVALARRGIDIVIG